MALSALLKASSRLTMVVEGGGMKNAELDWVVAGGSEGTGRDGSCVGTKVLKSSGAVSSSSSAAAAGLCEGPAEGLAPVLVATARGAGPV